jgi:hypothetical protein
MIPEKRVPHFRPGKALREAVESAPLDQAGGASASMTDAVPDTGLR